MSPDAPRCARARVNSPLCPERGSGCDKLTVDSERLRPATEVDECNRSRATQKVRLRILVGLPRSFQRIRKRQDCRPAIHRRKQVEATMRGYAACVTLSADPRNPERGELSARSVAR